MEEYKAGFTRHRVLSLIYHLLCRLVEWRKICFLQLLGFFFKGGVLNIWKTKGEIHGEEQRQWKFKGNCLKD